MRAHSSHSVHLLYVYFLLTPSVPPDSEVCLAEQEQRFSRPRGHGAGRLRCHLQYLWTAGKLPAGVDPHPNASTRLDYMCSFKYECEIVVESSKKLVDIELRCLYCIFRKMVSSNVMSDISFL